MGNQKKRYYSEYNPSLRNRVSSVYMPWLFVLSILIFVVGVLICALAAYMKASVDEGFDDLIFYVWVGIPLVAVSVIGFIVLITRMKTVVNIFAFISLCTMVVCGFAAISGGINYWERDFEVVRGQLDDNLCLSSITNFCQCPKVPNFSIKVDNCDSLELVVIFFIVEYSLAAGSMVLCFLAVLLSMMMVCCGPWTYIPWYDRTVDPDNIKHKKKRYRPSVREEGIPNKGYI